MAPRGSTARRTSREDLVRDLERILAGRRRERVSHGRSGAEVFRLEGGLFYKRGPGTDDEALRLAWLAGRVPVPEIVARAPGHLVTRVLPGRPLHEAPDEAGVRAFARALRHLHEVDLSDCPFDHGAAQELARATRRVELGLVDERDFDPERRGRSALSLLQEARVTQPSSERRALTHGDTCLPNVLVDGDRVGFVDLGRSGAGDPLRDLALAVWSLRYNAGPMAPFFDEYGERPDDAALAWYRLIDELF